MKTWADKAIVILEQSLEISEHELNEIDWKVTLSDKNRIVDHLCAMSNHAGGGFLVFGINADSSIVGVDKEEIERISNKVSNLGREAVEHPLQLDHLAIEFREKKLLLVYIPESSIKPVHRKNGSLDKSHIRSLGTTRIASPAEIGSMLMHSKTTRWEDLRASTLLSDQELLDSLQIDPIFRMLQIPRLEHPELRLEWMAASSFIERHPSAGGYITNLGAIAAAKDMAFFPDLSRRAVRVIVYKGLNKTGSHTAAEGHLGYAIGFEGLFRYVSDLLASSEVIEQALRVKKTVYPELALREIIANALIHQDFTITGSGPMIEIFDDRIEISNPGKLLPSKSLVRLIGTHPESRNEKLARTFRRFRICEEQGSGLIKAITQIELFGLPPIRFEEGENYFKVTMFTPRTFAQMTSSERLNAVRQHAELKYFSSSVLTNKSLRERLKMPEKQRSMVSALILEALDKGLIVPANPENKSRKFTEYLPTWTSIG